jgi:hypothetical protein
VVLTLIVALFALVSLRVCVGSYEGDFQIHPSDDSGEYVVSSTRFWAEGALCHSFATVFLGETEEEHVYHVVENLCTLQEDRVAKGMMTKCPLYLRATAIPSLNRQLDLGVGNSRGIYGEYSVGTIWKVLRLAECHGALYP